MRITNNMLINNMMNYIGNNLTRMDKLQAQLASGKKISVPSDDPVVAARALKLRTDVAEIDQYQRNTKDAQSWMEITEDTLAKIGDVLSRARELAVEGSNGTLETEDSQKINEEIQQLRKQLIHLGNATYAGRYIFSGYKTDTKLLDEETGYFAINVGNGENIKYEIGVGDDIEINVPGGDLFNNGGAAVGTSSGVTTGKSDVSSLEITAGVNDTLNVTLDGDTFSITIPPNTYADINALAAAIQTEINNEKQPTTAAVTVSAIGGKLQFTSGSTGATSSVAIGGGSAAATLGLTDTTSVTGTTSAKGKLIDDFDKLIAALNNGDNTAVSNLLDDFDDDINNLLRIRADIGARVNRIELTANRLDNDDISFTKLMSENENVDMAETIMYLMSEENVYRASLAGGARIIQPSLIDFLR